MKRILLAIVTVLLLAAPGFGEPGACLDNCIVGDRLLAQQAQYEEVRDKIVAFRQGEIELTEAELIDLVQQECDYATKSWVRANCFHYLGLLKKKAGDKAGAIAAFKECLKYSVKAQKMTAKQEPNEVKLATSHSEGAKFEALATKALGIKKK